MVEQVVRGPLLLPRDGGGVDYFADGALAGGETLAFAGDWQELQKQLPAGQPVRRSDGVMLPPLLDIHVHIPQHPIRGQFVEGVPDDAVEGKLLAGLKRNVFPAEMRCDDPAVAEAVTRDFLSDTLAHGVVGGAAYMTTSALATEVALSVLPDTWSVGLVLMNQNCPAGYCTREDALDADVKRLADRFGRRLIITDRFAVAVDSPLRRRASRLAQKYGLRTQTHLDEQPAEKAFVEDVLYPDAANYTDVYRRDGLLDHDCIAAHCVHVHRRRVEHSARHERDNRALPHLEPAARFRRNAPLRRAGSRPELRACDGRRGVADGLDAGGNAAVLERPRRPLRPGDAGRGAVPFDARAGGVVGNGRPARDAGGGSADVVHRGRRRRRRPTRSSRSCRPILMTRRRACGGWTLAGEVVYEADHA